MVIKSLDYTPYRFCQIDLVFLHSATYHLHCTMHIASCTLHHAHCTLNIAPCIFYYAYGRMHITPCTIVICILQHAHCTMHIVPCILYYRVSIKKCITFFAYFPWLQTRWDIFHLKGGIHSSV